jgi:uncharacterized protein
MRIWLVAALLVCSGVAQAAVPEPVIDMHLHAMPADGMGPPHQGMCTPLAGMPAWDPKDDYPSVFLKMFKEPQCADPVWSPETDDAVRDRTIAVMKRLNVTGVLSGSPERVAEWRAKAPGLFMPGYGLRFSRRPDVALLEQLHRDGRLDVLAEVTTWYEGIAPDDPRLEPYWAMAERLDLPVGIHVGPGPPGVMYLDAPGARIRLSSALTMEPVLVKHPKLRVYLMHAGFPFAEDTIALMYLYPQVYVDTGVIIYTQPRADFYDFIGRIIRAGMGSRIMFGSDQMVWPETIERSIRVIEEAPMLSKQQKRDILFNNAARFLRLSPDEIARLRAGVH